MTPPNSPQDDLVLLGCACGVTSVPLLVAVAGNLLHEYLGGPSVGPVWREPYFWVLVGLVATGAAALYKAQNLNNRSK